MKITNGGKMVDITDQFAPIECTFNRDLVAAMAMMAIFGKTSRPCDEIASQAYAMADAMIAEGSKK